MGDKTDGDEPRYWIGVASQDHVRAGVEGGFAQLGHGKHSAVRLLRKGDWIAYYSPREHMGEGEPVQAFTAIGRIVSDAPYESDMMMADHKAWRVDVEFNRKAEPALIRPILEDLDLTKDRGSKWGMAFRRSKAEVSRADMERIGRAMGVEV